MTTPRLLSAALALLAAPCSLLQAAKPNIIVILADDIGFGDVSCYGAKHAKTPNIDRIAAQGCRFTDAHSPASTCTPTRRALMSGVYSWRQQPGSSIAPGDAALSITPGSPTVASILQKAGYRTGAIGKWHIGLGPEGGPDWNHEIKPGPRELGYDYHFIMAATGDRVPTVFIENSHVVGLDPADPIKVSYEKKVGNEPTGAENPELLKLKHTHGHDMTIVNGVGRIGWMTGGKAARWKDEDMADTFTGKALKFIEDSKSAPFFLYFATHNIHVPRVPNPRFKGSSPVGIRGDSIHELDDSVGKVLAKLDELKLTDNTLLIFTSDNGGVMDDGYEDVGSFDYNPNTPLNGHKGTVFEGGHRVPFIARWPGKIKPATESDALIAHLDLPRTFAALTGVELAKNDCADGLNVLPALLGESKTARATFVAHNGGTKGPFGFRAGNWKLITGGPAGPGANAAKRTGKVGNANAKTPPQAAGVQLYDLSQDLGETRNLAGENPAKLREMQDLLAKIRGE
jgi:arylsulfatase A-like enzyme